jgi:hypothetical protein
MAMKAAVNSVVHPHMEVAASTAQPGSTGTATAQNAFGVPPHRLAAVAFTVPPASTRGKRGSL